VLVAPWLTIGLAEFDKMVARGPLGRTKRLDFEERVTGLQQSRVAAVDSDIAERRRIERDLYDGAQRRLIAVAMGAPARSSPRRTTVTSRCDIPDGPRRHQC